MLQQTTKFIVSLILLVGVIKLTNCQTFELGNDSNYNFTMRYLEGQGDEALRLKFMVESSEVMRRDKAHLAICCHTLPTPPVEEPAPEESTPEESTPEESTPEEPTTEEPTTEEPAPEEPATEEPAPEEPTPIESPTTPSNGNRRRLAEEDLGNCFGIKFDCIGKNECKNSYDATISLYSSSIKDETIFSAGGNDLFAGNIGTAFGGSPNQYITRYKFNENDAKKTNIPLVGTEAHMTCYTAYNVSVSTSALFKDQDLSDSKKFTSVKDIVFAVTDESIKEDLKANPEEVSGAFQSVVQISFLCAILAMFTIF